MNTIFPEIWKQVNKLKGRWGFVGKLFLGLLILSISVPYLFWRFPAILRDGESQIDTAVIAISAIIILLPFLSEIELFGVKFKKEIEELEKSTNEKIKQMDQRLLSIQSQNITQNFYQPKPDDELKKLTESAQEAVGKGIKAKSTDEGSAYQVPKEIVELFSLRWKLRNVLRRLYKKAMQKVFLTENYKTDALTQATKTYQLMTGQSIDRLNTQQIIEILTKNDMMHEDISEIIKEIVAICDNAYFGNRVTDEQISFVHENANVLDYLENV